MVFLFPALITRSSSSSLTVFLSYNFQKLFLFTTLLPRGLLPDKGFNLHNPSEQKREKDRPTHRTTIQMSLEAIKNSFQALPSPSSPLDTYRLAARSLRSQIRAVLTPCKNSGSANRWHSATSLCGGNKKGNRIRIFFFLPHSTRTRIHAGEGDGRNGNGAPWHSCCPWWWWWCRVRRINYPL